MRGRWELWLLWPCAALVSRLAVALPANPLNDALVQSGPFSDTDLPYLLAVGVVKGAASATGPLLAAALKGVLRARRGAVAGVAAILAGAASALATTGWGAALTVPLAEYSALVVSFLVLFPVPGRERRRASVLLIAVPAAIAAALVTVFAIGLLQAALRSTALRDLPVGRGWWPLLPWVAAWVILVLLAVQTRRLSEPAPGSGSTPEAEEQGWSPDGDHPCVQP